MATFSSKATIVNTPAEVLAEKLSDFSPLQAKIDSLPEEQRQKIGNIRLTPDSIVMTTPQVGDITLQVTERTPSRLALTAVGSPVPMNLEVELTPVDSASTSVITKLNVDIPPFLKAMVGGTLQKAVDQFGTLIQTLV